jgi:hypothetical protein
MASNQKPILKPAVQTATPKTSSSPLPRLMLMIVIVMSVLIFLFAIGANYFGSSAKKAGSTTELSIKQIIVGNDVLNIPANVFRFEEQRQATTSKRLDLIYYWPGVQGYSQSNHELFYGHESSTENLIFSTIENRIMQFDMSARLQPVYSNLLEGKQKNSVTGLVYQRLRPEAGYSGEEIHYQPAIQPQYVVLCQRSENREIAASCMRDIHIGKGLSLTYRFSKKLLPHWRAIETTMQKLTRGYLSN